MRDEHGRTINYLRVSVTDRCNLRCVYCLPEEGVSLKSHAEMLTLEEIQRVVRVAVSLGVTGVRLTGGEPLVRKGIVDLVAALSKIDGLRDLSLTTNGTLLAPLAEPLYRAGLKRINLSLDTLRPERFAAVTRRPLFDQAVEGLRAALAVGFDPVKLNVVLMRGFNDDEIVDLARLATRPFAPGLGAVHVRFIELMPLGESALGPSGLRVTGEEVRGALGRAGQIVPAGRARPAGHGPARHYRWVPADVNLSRGSLPTGFRPATIGFISAISEHFCDRCNRLRLNADGKINPCLASPLEIDLRPTLRSGAGDDALARLLALAVASKPKEHEMSEENGIHERRMSRIGG